MSYDEILNRLAPCGLHCGKCFAFNEGEIRNYSLLLKESLGDFDAYAKRFVELIDEPSFLKYPKFKELLTYFSAGQCQGCRKEKCKMFKNCRVRDCHVQKNVDFCFQCPDFPCNNTGFDEHLHKRSVDINWRLKEIGVEKYYEEIKDKSRY
jgi:hypothetical protein